MTNIKTTHKSVTNKYNFTNTTQKPLLSTQNIQCIGPNANYNFVGSSLNTNKIIGNCTGLSSIDNNTIFVLQSDGNVVLYNKKTNKPLWNSNTSNIGVAPYSLRYEADGNLILLDSNQKILWFSGSINTSGMNQLLVQDNNIVNINNINNNNKITWQTKTSFTGDRHLPRVQTTRVPTQTIKPYKL